MKKIVFAAVLGLLLQTSPANASYSPPPPSPSSSHTGLVTLLFLFPGLAESAGVQLKVSDSGSPAEFSHLNSFPENLALLSQEAGGSMSTLDILK